MGREEMRTCREGETSAMERGWGQKQVGRKRCGTASECASESPSLLLRSPPVQWE